MSRAIILLARAPSASGKTRLTEGRAPAAGEALRRALLLDTFSVIRGLGIPIVVNYTPEEAGQEIEGLLADEGLRFRAQSGSDLGARMHDAIVDAFETGVRDVVLIGSDLPSLPVVHVVDAFTFLESGTDVVLGPADDGGYYLAGVGRGTAPAQGAERFSGIFQGIAWGTAEVLTETLVAAHASGLMTAMVPPWFDIDVPEDLRRLVLDPRPTIAPRTRQWLATRDLADGL